MVMMADSEYHSESHKPQMPLERTPVVSRATVKVHYVHNCIYLTQVQIVYAYNCIHKTYMARARALGHCRGSNKYVAHRGGIRPRPM